MRLGAVVGTALALVVTASPVAAQQPSTKIPRIGILTPAENEATPVFRAFREGLRELGYIEGETVVIEYRFGTGSFDPLPALAADLVRLSVDVIVTDGGAKAAQIAGAATSTIPIVATTSGDPVAQGLTTSLARPSGNITGLTLMSPELSAKRLQLVKEAFPEASLVAVLWNPTTSAVQLRATEAAARALGLQLRAFEASAPETLSGVFDAARRDGAQTLLVLPDAIFWNQRARIVALAAASRLPALYPEREYADAGGLLAYGPNVPDNFRRAARYVDKILKGAKPGDLPFEEPTKFEMIVNLRSAKALDLTIPQSIMVRADEVIE